MNRRPTDLRRYVLVRNLKRYVKAHESFPPVNGNLEERQQENIADPNVKQEASDTLIGKQETIISQNIKQEIFDLPSIKQESTQSSDETDLPSRSSDTVDEGTNKNPASRESASSKDTDLNTSAFSIVASLFKPRKKRKKGVAKAKIVVKTVKCKKQPFTCAKEKESVSKKPKSLFSLFKSRKEKRNIALRSTTSNPCPFISSASSTSGTTTQSCQTDITWPDNGFDELQRSNQVLQESNRLLIENLSTLIQNINTKPVSPQQLGICTDAYGCESNSFSVEPEPSHSGLIETERQSPIRTRSYASKLHRSQTLMESCKSFKICTRSKSMLNSDRPSSPLRTYSKTPPSNFLHSSPYQLRSTVLKDLPLNTSHGIHRRSSMPERTSVGPMRPLLRRRSNNIFDYNHGSVSYPLESNTAPKPPSENFPLNKVKKSIVRRSSMPDRVSTIQRRSAVQRRNTLSFHDKHHYKQGDYNCSVRFQDLPNEAFY